MQPWKTLLALPLAALLATGTAAQSDTTDPEPGREHPGAGRLGGAWKKAGIVQPGHMRGRLVNAKGVAVARVEARLVRKVPLLPCGVVIGKTTLLAGPREGKTLPLRGLWTGQDPHSGVFSARVLAPDKEEEKPKTVLRLRGRFRDGAKPGPGAFRGHWTRT